MKTASKNVESSLADDRNIDKPLVVDITVHSTGSNNKARAGKGKHAFAASSTSDPLTAAYRAAAKWFDLPTDQIIVKHTSEAGNMRHYVGRPIAAHEIFTIITFEDHGQDFTTWTVAADGVVVDCRPFQSWLWCNYTVINLPELTCGGSVIATSPINGLITMRYPIATLARKDASA